MCVHMCMTMRMWCVVHVSVCVYMSVYVRVYTCVCLCVCTCVFRVCVCACAHAHAQVPQHECGGPDNSFPLTILGSELVLSGLSASALPPKPSPLIVFDHPLTKEMFCSLFCLDCHAQE